MGKVVNQGIALPHTTHDQDHIRGLTYPAKTDPSLQLLSQGSKNKTKNIQQRVFASGHPPDY
jgi:hypothetical protein